MDRADIKQLADVVAEAIFRSCSDEDWADADVGEREQFLLSAHAAIRAHADFLTKCGFRVLPAGAVMVPTCKEEATAMVMAVKKFRDGEGLIKPKLIMPPSAMH